jgi:exosome complex RNA-binding protein Rrp42 (RNase PH superfamily)
MAAPEDTLLSVNQKTFVLRALIDGLRTDGRFFHESRKVRIKKATLLQVCNTALALPPPLAPCLSMI